jgi:hypothetical protein
MFKSSEHRPSSSQVKGRKFDFTRIPMARNATMDARTFERFYLAAELLEVHAAMGHPYKTELCRRKLHELGAS